MALTSGSAVMRRGPPVPGEYGYPVAPGEQIWRGSLVGLNANGQLIRMQTATAVAFAGISMQDYSNVGNANASPDYVHVARGIWGLTVPGATAANLNAPVYAIDDNTLTLTAGTAGTAEALVVGTLNGFGQSGESPTWVRLTGS